MPMQHIHHVAIICSDYPRAKHFYTVVLGLQVIAETYREARDSWKLDLAIGAAQIELFSFPGAPARPSYPEAQACDIWRLLWITLMWRSPSCMPTPCTLSRCVPMS